MSYQKIKGKKEGKRKRDENAIGKAFSYACLL
jgi:hypothetical protein